MCRYLVKKDKSTLRVYSGLVIIFITVLLVPLASNAAGAPIVSQSIPVLAVSSDDLTSYVYPGLGEIVNMTIDVSEGSGRVLINTNINSGGMWQNSTRTAVHVAESVTHQDLSSKDVVFTALSLNASRQLGNLDGTSAGGAMTVLLTSELEGKRINNYTIMTGAINPDGTIGRVGGVLEKAVTAGKSGAKIMLVPPGQAYYPQGACLTQGDSKEQNDVPRVCVLEYKSISDIMKDRYNMKVIEVHNVQQALSYFQSTNPDETFDSMGQLEPPKMRGAI